MRWTVLALILLACSGDGPPPRSRAPEPRAPEPPAAPEGAALEHLEIVTGGAAADARLPMIVAIHGLGDSPEGFVGLLEDFARPARIIVPRAPEPYYGGFGWFPLDSTAAQIRRRADQLAASIRRWTSERPTIGLPVITGFSQGGMLSFSVAVLHPETVRASIPIAGRLPEELVPSAPRAGITYPRVHAMHGTDDDLIPVTAGRAAIRVLQSRGFPADDLEEYPAVPHTITPGMQRALHAHLAANIAP